MLHRIVSRDEWLAERKVLLASEKEFSRQRDDLSRQRRAMPWVRIDKHYEFESPQGKQTLPDLFDGRSQLVIYHFMLGPGWKDGCPICSLIADHFDGAVVHIAERDVSFAAVSRAPLPEIEAYKARMGWRFRWVSSFGNDFNHDFGVSFSKDELDSGSVEYNYAMTRVPAEEMPGISTFIVEDGAVFHTYSSYARGLDMLIGAYNLLDLTPRGRDEDGLSWTMAWVRRHDEYGRQQTGNPS